MVNDANSIFPKASFPTVLTDTSIMWQWTVDSGCLFGPALESIWANNDAQDLNQSVLFH
jgi:hypothetical protein